MLDVRSRLGWSALCPSGRLALVSAWPWAACLSDISTDTVSDCFLYLSGGRHAVGRPRNACPQKPGSGVNVPSAGDDAPTTGRNRQSGSTNACHPRFQGRGLQSADAHHQRPSGVGTLALRRLRPSPGLSHLGRHGARDLVLSIGGRAVAVASVVRLLTTRGWWHA